MKKRIFKRYRTKKRGGQRYWISDKNSKYLKKLSKYQIKVKDLNNFGGMNHYAAKELNFKPMPQKNEIFIEKDKPNFMESTLIHELTEAELMKKGMRYKTAHKKAINAEIDAGLVSKKILLKNNRELADQLKQQKKNYGMVWSIQPGQYIEHMPPREFIKKAGLTEEEIPQYLDKYYDSKKEKMLPIKELSKHIISPTTKVYIPWIEDPSAEHTGHEGRHRAFAAELAGEKLIPVAIPLPKEKREKLAEEFINKAFPDSHSSYKEEWRERFRKGHPEHSMDIKTTNIFGELPHPKS